MKAFIIAHAIIKDHKFVTLFADQPSPNHRKTNV